MNALAIAPTFGESFQTTNTPIFNLDNMINVPTVFSFGAVTLFEDSNKSIFLTNTKSNIPLTKMDGNNNLFCQYDGIDESIFDELVSNEYEIVSLPVKKVLKGLNIGKIKKGVLFVSENEIEGF